MPFNEIEYTEGRAGLGEEEIMSSIWTCSLSAAHENPER